MKKETTTLAILIALLPPIWAVIAPYIGIEIGAVALICASLYVASGNQIRQGVPLSLGLLLGDLWAIIAMNIILNSSLNGDVTVFLTLAIMGGAAVLISSFSPKWISTTVWLCGWAIGLTVLAFVNPNIYMSMCLQIGIAMLAGIWYVGVILGIIHQKLNSKS